LLEIHTWNCNKLTSTSTHKDKGKGEDLMLEVSSW
jgi:hypothetical protein